MLYLCLLVDPPGAPRTYSTNYPIVQADSMTRSWSAALDVNNAFYPNTSLSIPTGPSTLSHIPPQYNHDYTYFNPPPSVPVEERPSKKVQFARPIERKISSSSNNPLTATQSWHEPSLTNTSDAAVVPTKQETLLAKTSLHHSGMPTKTHTSMPPATTAVQKPIYVSIDHRATLAERGQIKAGNRHHKNTEKNHSTTSNHHRSRGHTQQQQSSKHHESIDAPASKQSSSSSNKPLESLNHRPVATTSTPTIILHKPIQPIEPSSNHDQPTKRTRHSHQPPNQHIEQQSFNENDTRPVSTRGNSSQTKQHSRSTANRPTSPVRNEVIRRVEIRQPITSGNSSHPTSQNQSRSKSFQQTTTSNNITRTRI